MRFNIFAIAGLIPYTLAVAVTPVGNNDAALNTDTAPINFGFTEKHIPALEYFFTTICAIPDDTLYQGKESTNKWLVDHGFVDANAALIPDGPSEISALNPREESGIILCVASIGAALASTAFPPAKLLQLKKIVKAAGGIRAAAKLLLGGGKISSAGKLIGNLSADILGISTILTNCTP